MITDAIYLYFVISFNQKHLSFCFPFLAVVVWFYQKTCWAWRCCFVYHFCGITSTMLSDVWNSVNKRYCHLKFTELGLEPSCSPAELTFDSPECVYAVTAVISLVGHLIKTTKKKLVLCTNVFNLRKQGASRLRIQLN